MFVTHSGQFDDRYVWSDLCRQRPVIADTCDTDGVQHCETLYTSIASHWNPECSEGTQSMHLVDRAV
jgi:hypothetical protein